MKIKNKLFVFIPIVILLNVSLISAAPELSQLFDVSKSKGVEADLENGIFTFSESGGALYIIGNDGNMHTYSNIEPANENLNSFIKMDIDGTINSLDLTASDKTSIYINGVFLPLEKGSRVIYNSKNGVLEVSSNSNSVMNIPRFSENVFQSTPKEIMFTSLGGADLTLSKYYTLKDGSLKYSLNDRQFYVPKGKVSVLNDFKIDAQSKNVLLGKDVKFSGDSLYSLGSGFKISFNSDTSTFNTGESSISLKNSANGKSFQIGDSGSDVSNIQRIVGLNPTGKYDQVTKQAVEKWQSENGLLVDGKFGENSLKRANSRYGFDLSKSLNGKYFGIGDKGEDVKSIQSMLVSQGYLSKTFTNAYGKEVSSIDGDFGFRTAEALKKWQKDNNLNPDGRFGEFSVGKAKNLENNVVVSMLGGLSKITNGRNGLDISLRGKTAIEVGGESYSFDGKNLKQSLWPTLKSNLVSTPTKITFIDDKGKEFEVSLDTNDKQINSIVEINKAAKKVGIDPNGVYCSGYTQVTNSLMIEKEGGNFFTLGEGLSAQKAGVVGQAWTIQENILDKGGRVVYTKEDELTEQQKLKINALKKKANENIEKYMKEGLSKYQSIKKASDDIRRELGAILNQDQLSSQVITVKGDVISMYYRDSTYLAEALTNGANNQKNTHVGSIVGSTNDYATLSSDKNILEQLKTKLGVSSENSLYVNTYSYVNERGNLEPIILKDNKFYLENGQEFSFRGSKEIIVNRPKLAHQKGAGNVKIEHLDKVLSGNDMALYGVTRPKYTDYLTEYYNFPSSTISIENNRLGCNTLDCKKFNLEQVLTANNIPDSTNWAQVISTSTFARQQEFNLPHSQINDFEAITNAILRHETGFGERSGYKLERGGTSLGLTKISDTKGYMSVDKEYIKRSAQNFGEDTPDMKKIFTNKEESIKYGQRYLAETFKIYAPEGEKLNADQLRLILAAYNSGQYTPVRAALQEQLKEMGYISPTTRLTGNLGLETKEAFTRFAADNNIDIDIDNYIKDISANPKLMEDTILYKKIKQEYKLKTGKDPEYAIIPDLKKSMFARTKTVEEYSQLLLDYYMDFCPDCI